MEFKSINVFEGIWIANIASCVKEKELVDRKIKYVLILSQECCLNLFKSINYLHIPLGVEEKNVAVHLDKMADFIEKGHSETLVVNASKPSNLGLSLAHTSRLQSGVLIIDTEGEVRAGMAIAAYLIKYKNHSTESACKLVLEKVNVNFTKEYKDQLKLFEPKKPAANKEEQKDRNTNKTVEEGVDDKKKLTKVGDVQEAGEVKKSDKETEEEKNKPEESAENKDKNQDELKKKEELEKKKEQKELEKKNQEKLEQKKEEERREQEAKRLEKEHKEKIQQADSNKEEPIKQNDNPLSDKESQVY
jgi:hypothetical protein